jgi:Ca-activated chloride channel family protein
MKALARACLFLAILRTAAPQVLLNPPRPPDVISVQVDLVNVLCSVRDKHGAYVSGLRQEDFEIRVDGKPRPISNFAAEVSSPLTVALLLDVSGSVAGVLPEEKEGARRFFGQVLRPGDQALLAGFAQLIAIWQDLTPSAPLVQEALGRAAPFQIDPARQQLETRPRGGTLLYDAVSLVATRKLKPVAGLKTMVLITDGMDNGSIADSAKAVQAAQEADTVIYAIRYEDPRFSTSFADGLGNLNRLATPTGGRVFDATRGKLQDAFDAIGEEMRNQYGLGFAPAEAAGQGKFHRLEVRLRKSGLKAQARAGYYR